MAYFTSLQGSLGGKQKDQASVIWEEGVSVSYTCHSNSVFTGFGGHGPVLTGNSKKRPRPVLVLKPLQAKAKLMLMGTINFYDFRLQKQKTHLERFRVRRMDEILMRFLGDASNFKIKRHH